MSEPGLNADGFLPKRLDQISSDVDQGVRDIFGPNINLDPETPDGQINGVLSENYSELWQLAYYVYSAFDPESAVGVALSRLVILNGLRRNGGTFSTAVLTFTGTAGTIIPENYQVAVEGTDGKDIFATIEETEIEVGGTVDVIAQATIAGAVQANPNTITEIVLLIGGITSVTNADPATPGRDEEDDIELRIRRRESTEVNSSNLLDSLYSKLNSLLNVSTARVYENDKDVVDANGLPKNSFNAIILGGDNLEIAQTIWTTKPPGIEAFSTFNNSTDIIDSQGITRSIYYDRPLVVPIYIVIDTIKLSNWPEDGEDLIKDAIVQYAENKKYYQFNYKIGQNVVRTRLFEPINSIQGHSVQELFIDIVPLPSGVVDLPMAFNELAKFEIANITVNAT